MAIETVAAWLIANPEVIPAVTSIGSSIYESLFPDEVLHSVGAISVSRPLKYYIL